VYHRPVPPPNAEISDHAPDPQAVLEALPERGARLQAQLRRVVVGQDRAVELLLIAALCQRHALLVGVPGLAKTTLVRAVARLLELTFRRVQFTPDLMPGDVTGSELLQPLDPANPAAGFRLVFQPGPIFGNLVLADEVNRAPPRTQAALLEAMAERQVTVGGLTHPLPDPFLVIATQNPIEQDGTYPLPEAQLDRFSLAVHLGYPTPAEERRIVAEAESFPDELASIAPVLTLEELRAARSAIGRMPITPAVVDEAVALARASRPEDERCPRDLRPYIAWGAGPRAGQDLVLLARAMAALAAEPTPRVEHVRALAPAVLGHRLVLSDAAAAEGVRAPDVVARVIEAGVRSAR